MKEFQRELKTALSDLFNPTSQEQHEINQIAKQAGRLRSTLNKQDDKTLDLTADFIVTKMEERVDNGPKWAWNNWIGTAVAFGIIPTGYQIA